MTKCFQHRKFVELEKLENLHVISKVTNSTRAAPIVILTKINNKLQMYADFSMELNMAIMSHTYSLLTVKNMFWLNEAKFS